MATTNAQKQGFSIIRKSKNDYQLHFRGKLLGETNIPHNGCLFYLKGKPEVLFNFDAALLPPGFEYQLIHRPDGFFDWSGLITISVIRKKVCLDYFFCINEDVLLIRDINPYKILVGAMALAKKAGYRVELDKKYLHGNGWATIKVLIPPAGNLYQHYQKHLLQFQSFFQATVASIIKNLQTSPPKPPVNK